MSHSDGRPGRIEGESALGTLVSPGARPSGSTDSGGNGFSIEQAAAELHASNRRRADLFSHVLMADSVMDIMLTALIVEEQGTSLTRVAAAMANRLDLREAERVIDDLIEARLLEGRGADRIGVTRTGADQMRDYVRRMFEIDIIVK